MRKIYIYFGLFISTIFTAAGQSATTEKEFKKIKSKIFPIVKVKEDSSAENSIKFTDENAPLFSEIGADLRCFYGIDYGSKFVLVSKQNIPATLSINDLDALAKENLLDKAAKELRITETPFGAFGLICGDNLEASLILLPEIWSVITQKVGQDVVFGIPSKDMFFFTSKNETKQHPKLQDMISEIYNDGEQIVSRKMYRYKDGKIELN